MPLPPPLPSPVRKLPAVKVVPSAVFRGRFPLLSLRSPRICAGGANQVVNPLYSTLPLLLVLLVLLKFVLSLLLLMFYPNDIVIIHQIIVALPMGVVVIFAASPRRRPVRRGALVGIPRIVFTRTMTISVPSTFG